MADEPRREIALVGAAVLVVALLVVTVVRPDLLGLADNATPTPTLLPDGWSPTPVGTPTAVSPTTKPTATPSPGTPAPIASPTFIDNEDPMFAGYAIQAAASSVAMEWTEPTVTCPAQSDRGLAIWVGIKDERGQLQQAGIFSRCVAGGLDHLHGPFWEAFPAPATFLYFDIAPGDRLRAEVSMSGKLWTYTVANLTSGESRSGMRDNISMEPITVEWQIERALCPRDFSSVCPLPRFTPFTITNAMFTVDGGSMTIGSKRPAPNLVRRDLMTTAELPLITLGDLSADGSAFTVSRTNPGS